MIARMERGGGDHLGLVLVNLGTEIREEMEEGRREEGGEGGVKKKWTSRAQLRNTARCSRKDVGALIRADDERYPVPIHTTWNFNSKDPAAARFN